MGLEAVGYGTLVRAHVQKPPQKWYQRFLRGVGWVIFSAGLVGTVDFTRDPPDDHKEIKRQAIGREFADTIENLEVSRTTSVKAQSNTHVIHHRHTPLSKKMPHNTENLNPSNEGTTFINKDAF